MPTREGLRQGPGQPEPEALGLLGALHMRMEVWYMGDSSPAGGGRQQGSPARSNKPQVYGLKGPKGWFYVVDCPKCYWSWGWDGQAEWHQAVEVGELHYWLYAETEGCLGG